MNPRMIVEIDASEIKDVLISYLRNKTNADVDEDTFRVCMKDVYNPIIDRNMRVFDKCRIEVINTKSSKDKDNCEATYSRFEKRSGITTDVDN